MVTKEVMMTDRIDFEVPRFGDDGLFPDARGWWSVPLTVSLWSAVFTIVYFATRNLQIEDSIIASGYITILFIVFVMVIIGVIPALTMTFGRMVDDALRNEPRWKAGMVFGGIGLALAIVPAVFVWAVDHTYGWLPFTQFLIPSPIAGFLGSVLVDPVIKSSVAKTTVVVSTAVIVIGCLGIGVAVLTGAL
jgi:hypothetical protein